MKEAISNHKIIWILQQIADFSEIAGESSFKISAYHKAAETLQGLDKPITEMMNLEGLTGIGKGTAAIIREIIQSGESSLLQELKKKIPLELLTILKIPGIGPKRVGRLYRELGITTIDQLELAGEKQKIRALSGFGAKTELKILKGIKQMRMIPDFIPIAVSLPIARQLKEMMETLPFVENVTISGGLRRYAESVKEIDLVVVAEDVEQVFNYISDLPFTSKVLSKENTKISVVMEFIWPIVIRIHLTSSRTYAFTLFESTGSSEHLDQIEFLNPKVMDKIKVSESEEEIYKQYNLPFIPPELREGKGEIEFVGREGFIPHLIRLEDIQGDLHMHTKWSDGGNTIEEMARAAYQRGYRFIAITDHSRSLKIAGGLSIEKLMEQKEQIKKLEKELRKEWEDFHILCGVEMDILADGVLDYPDEVLAELDFVIGSIHSAFRQDEAKMTKRIIGAIENNHVNMIAHPTGRLIGQREPYPVNIDLLIKAAKETGTVLELNSNPNRLDLKPEYLQIAIENGVLLSINTDAHSIEELANMEIGVGSARRGWVTSEHVINTWSIERLKKYLQRKL